MKPYSPLLLIVLVTAILHAVTPPSFADEHARLDQQGTALRAAAIAFCTELHREPISGLPSSAQLQRLSPLITPELKALFEHARDLQQQMMRKHPDDKPMWIEGDLFSSMFEGATGWEIEKVIAPPTIDPVVKLKQRYVESGQKPITWTDMLVFKKQSDRWLLDDIRMGGNWDFKTCSSLRASLPGGGREGENHESLNELWKVSFIRDGDKTMRVTVQSTDKDSKPVVLYGNSAKEISQTRAWVVWSSECDRIALRIGDSAHFSHTLVFACKDGSWQPLVMPEIHAIERKTMRGNKFTERETFIDADHWQGANTLVVKYFTDWGNGSDGDGYSEFVTVRFDLKGGGTIVDIKDTPGND